MTRSAVVAIGGMLILGGCGHLRSSKPPVATASPLGAPSVAAGELDARALLADLSARASRLGAGAASLVSSAEAVENGWVGAFVDAPADECMLAYGRGAESIEDIDVAVYSEEGTSLAVDEGRDVHPTVLLCPPHPTRVYVAAHVVEGEGLVAVGAQRVPRERAVIVARALGARGGLAEGPRPAGAWPGLDEAVRSHRSELGGAWEEFKRVALPVDARLPTTVSLPIDPEQCVDALIVPDDSVALLDVEAVDGEGRVVARSREGAGPRTLTVCSPLQMDGALSIRPHVGLGLAAVVLARGRSTTARDFAVRPDVAWVAPSQSLDAAKKAREASLSKSGYGPPIAASEGSLVLGRRVSVPIDFRVLGSGCGRVDLVAGAPLALVEARVWDEAGSLLASSDDSGSMALFVCSHGVGRIELEARGRPGPYSVSVRGERWQDSAFKAHPLAASRLLSRAAVGAEMLFEGKQAPVRDLVLTSDQVVSWYENIGHGHCVRATVGAEGSGAGVELRIFDGTGTEIDRSESAHAASVRACATADASRSVRIELRASSGRMAALLSVGSTGSD
jgi:hypothetical protein